MTGYFSNYSQSRFLANSSATNSNGSATNAGATSPAAAQMASVNTRPRAPSSRHFSTSLSNHSSGDEKPSNKEKMSSGVNNGLVVDTVHPLRNTWVFWFRQQRLPSSKIVNYEEGIKRISSFASVESFWNIWTHMCRSSEVQPTTDYILFHSGVRRPVWEDPVNLQGGKWIIRLKKGVSERLWEELVMAIVGDQFDGCNSISFGTSGNASGAADTGNWRGNSDVGTGTDSGGDSKVSKQFSGNEPEICGCTLSVRQHEDILSVWNKHGSDSRINGRIRETIRKVLDLPPSTILEYKTNNDSMQDKSSFRQPLST